MALQSQLFRADARLEAAAISDTAHIARGAVGEHVRKIQLALNQLDGARLDSDGKFGNLTAAAVLAYKKKRGVINRSYQLQADDIVGKMTIAKMDLELLNVEPSPGPPRITVLSPHADSDRHVPFVALRPAGNGWSLVSKSSFSSKPDITPGPIVTLRVGQTARISIGNAKGGTITSSDATIAAVRLVGGAAVATVPIAGDPETVEIVAKSWGSVVLIAKKSGPPSLSFPDAMFMTSITVAVKTVHQTVYVPTMTPHNHRPVKDWNKLLDDIRQPRENISGAAMAALCAVHADPNTFVNAAIAAEFNDKPVAKKHLDWYLRDGRGQDYKEDDNIANWVRSDWGLRKRLARFILDNAVRGPRYHGWLEFTPGMYANQDYYYAFGTIDRLDVQFDLIAKTVKIWFKDSYEWHPVCDGYYTKFPDDEVRVTNSLHAALVQLKDRGAADYWMLGEATFPMSLLEMLWPSF